MKEITHFKLKIVFLMSFGHCGIDWLHSLLDSHPQILILPSFSFYRNWKILHLDQIFSVNEMVEKWRNFLEENPSQQGKDTKLLYNQEEVKRFYQYFKNYLSVNGISRLQTLKAIHNAYAYAKQLDTEQIKVVISHEHICFPFEDIIKDFQKPNIIMIVRDPRAALAGYFRGLNKKYPDRHDYYDYYFNMCMEEWMQAVDMWKKYRKELGAQLYLVKNEELSQDIKAGTRQLASWLGVENLKSLHESTYPSGVRWTPDSCYISREGLYPDNENPETFFAPENIKKRWIAELDPREILMIETMLGKVMDTFGYKKFYTINSWLKLKGVFYYLIPHRGKNRLEYYPADEQELIRHKHRIVFQNKRIMARLWDFSPTILKTAWIFFESVVWKFKSLYFPGDRWDRYDRGLY
jgi:hypothetical protein